MKKAIRNLDDVSLKVVAHHGWKTSVQAKSDSQKHTAYALAAITGGKSTAFAFFLGDGPPPSVPIPPSKTGPGYSAAA